VTGDKHLLGLQTYQSIPILTVNEFAEKLEKQTQ
jgi:predicted nucleic acid-binding protein